MEQMDHCSRRLCCKVMTAHSKGRDDLSFNCCNVAIFAYWTPFVCKGLERKSWGQTEINHETSWVKMATFWLWEGAEANNGHRRACRTARCRDVDTLHSTHHSSTITWRSLIPSRSYIAFYLRGLILVGVKESRTWDLSRVVQILRKFCCLSSL